jgi:hypothetical protein
MFYPPDPEAVNRSIDKAGTIVFARPSLSDNYINNFRLHLFTASGIRIFVPEDNKESGKNTEHTKKYQHSHPAHQTNRPSMPSQQQLMKNPIIIPPYFIGLYHIPPKKSIF